MNTERWEVMVVGSGGEDKYLVEGWEPFCVVAHNTSYEYNNGRNIRFSSADFIYLRRKVKLEVK